MTALPRPTLPPMSDRDRKIYETLTLSSAGLTMLEVFQYLALDTADRTGVFERMSPVRLAELGLVKRSAERRTCSVSGNKAFAWFAVPVAEARPCPRVTIESRYAALETRFIDFLNGVADAVQAGTTDPALEQKLRDLIKKASES